MAKAIYSPVTKEKVDKIFDDLAKFLEFCVDYGYKYDEAYLYDMRNYAFQQFSKYQAHKNFRDQWADDGRKAISNFE
jgi:SAM-dependent MidA family methyltransferase